MARTDVRPHYGTYRRVRTDGYVDLWDPEHPLARSDGYVFEHRKVAWDAGVLTDPSMQVHHKNHDKEDNRPENLEACGISAHAKKHAKFSGGWARDNREKTHCVNGHELSEGNLIRSRLPTRACWTCDSERRKAKKRSTP